MSLPTTVRNRNRNIFQVLTFLLLGAYAAGTSQSQIFHSLTHDHTAELHSDEQEEDACHRLIFHGDNERGCGHGAHLLVSDKCEMCDLVCHWGGGLLPAIGYKSIAFSQHHFTVHQSDFEGCGFVIASSRAPPSLS